MAKAKMPAVTDDGTDRFVDGDGNFTEVTMCHPDHWIDNSRKKAGTERQIAVQAKTKRECLDYQRAGYEVGAPKERTAE